MTKCRRERGYIWTVANATLTIFSMKGCDLTCEQILQRALFRVAPTYQFSTTPRDGTFQMFLRTAVWQYAPLQSDKLDIQHCLLSQQQSVTSRAALGKQHIGFLWQNDFCFNRVEGHPRCTTQNTAFKTKIVSGF